MVEDEAFDLWGIQIGWDDDVSGGGNHAEFVRGEDVKVCDRDEMDGTDDETEEANVACNIHFFAPSMTVMDKHVLWDSLMFQ